MSKDTNKDGLLLEDVYKSIINEQPGPPAEGGAPAGGGIQPGAMLAALPTILGALMQISGDSAIQQKLLAALKGGGGGPPKPDEPAAPEAGPAPAPAAPAAPPEPPVA